MSKDKISDYSATANSNTDIGGINIDEGCAPSGINDAIRTLMKQLKDWQSGSQDVYIHPAGSASVPSITATGDTNTGLFFPAADTVGITTGGTERARVDSSGNLGLGVTPSAWNTGSKAIQIGAQGAIEYRGNATSIAMNAYYDSVGWKYIASNAAALYYQYLNSHVWNIAASGTAGNAISFTQAMTLDASGNLGVGITSPSEKLDVAGVIQSKAADNAARLSVKDTNSGGATAYLNAAFSGAGTPAIQVETNHPLLFATNNTERARIDSSGNLLVGTTSNANVARIKLAWTTGGYGIESVASANTLSYHIVFQNASNTPGAISTTNNATTYATTSDYRLKENIAPMTGALATVAQLKPCTYTWKTDGSSGQGFIAHELQEVVPDAVVGEKDAVKEDGAPQYQNIDTSFLVATLTAAIQELKATVDAQAARITALEQA